MSTIANPLTGTASTQQPTSTTGSSGSSTSKTSSGTTNLANENTFLKLLVAQMQNQDPLSPVDSTQFVTQLAQYSSLEQLTGIKQDADTLVTAASSTTTPAPSTPNA